MTNARLLLVVGGAVAAVVLFVALRPQGDDGPEATMPAAPSGTTTSEAAGGTAGEQTPAPAAPPAAAASPPAVVRIAVRGGTVAGGLRRPSVAKGRRLVLHVTADVADHVHLHGYDLVRDVAPGRPARLAFRATVAGRFEVELEEHGLPLAELEVRP